MPLQASDILFRPAVAMGGASNGGVMGSSLIAPSAKNAVFPDVRGSERTSGSTMHRKVFIHFAYADNVSAALDVKIVPWQDTDSADWVVMRQGTLSDVESGVSFSTRCVGAAVLTTGAAIGDTTLQVQAAARGGETLYLPSDVLLLTNKANINDTSGLEQYVTVDSVTVVDAPAGRYALTLSAALTQALSAGVRVLGVLAAGDVRASAALGTVTSASAGTMLIGQLGCRGSSTISQTWTLTFTTNTDYQVLGAEVGSVGGSNVSSSFAPVNAALGGPYFTLPASAWVGSFTAGDVVTFTTAPAAVALWLTRTVPAGCASFTNATFTWAVDCEGA
jgi:hypothetical protein